MNYRRDLMAYWRVLVVLAAITAVGAVPALGIALLIEWKPIVGFSVLAAVCLFVVPVAARLLDGDHA